MSSTSAEAIHDPAWVPRIRDPGSSDRLAAPLIGVLPGEGVGPEVVDAALEVLRHLQEAGAEPVSIEVGGQIGKQAERNAGTALPDEVVRFCENVLGRGGAVLSGPGGGRYVYDLRRRLGLFMKVSPIRADLGYPDASPLRAESVVGTDLLVIRENLGGMYQGSSRAAPAADGGLLVEHRFSHVESDVRRFLSAAARLAASRRGELTVVVKQSGTPRVADLWRDVGDAVCADEGVRAWFVDVDLMAYLLVERPHAFDVVAAPNLFGDILGDLAAVVLGSRALSFGASYDHGGAGVYQTNHGAAYDIAGSGRANPVGQILSLAALLRESLGLGRQAWAIEEGVRRSFSEGLATGDLGGGLGTDEMAARVGSAAAQALSVA